jgi:hypothetical protein
MVVSPALTLFQPSVRSVRMPALHGALGDGRGGRAVHDERTDGFGDDEQFVNAFAALIALLAAGFATGAAPEFRRADFVLGKTDPRR